MGGNEGTDKQVSHKPNTFTTKNSCLFAEILEEVSIAKKYDNFFSNTRPNLAGRISELVFATCLQVSF